MVAAQISEYVRNCVAVRQDEQLESLERAFAQELFWRTSEQAEAGDSDGAVKT